MLTQEFTKTLNRILEEQGGKFWLPQPLKFNEQFESVGFKFGETKDDDTCLTTLPPGWKFKVDANYFANTSKGICLVDEYGNRRVKLHRFPYFESYTQEGVMELHPIPKNSLRKAKDLNEELAENGFCIIPKDAFMKLAACNDVFGEKIYFEAVGFQFKEIKASDKYQMFLPFNWKFEAHFDKWMTEYLGRPTGITSYTVTIVDNNGLQRGLLRYNSSNNIINRCELYNLMLNSTSTVNRVKNNGILFPLKISPNATELEKIGFEIRHFNPQQDEAIFLDSFGYYRESDKGRYYVKLPAGWKLAQPYPLTRPRKEKDLFLYRLLLIDQDGIFRGICSFYEGREKEIVLF